MRKLLTVCTITFICLGWLTSCIRPTKHYVIGVSQCSADVWREKQNAELRMDAYFQDNVELHFAAAYDSDERQVEQIDSLVATGIDLLIVAPNQVQTISPAIDRAYDKGIPVIVFERKTNSRKYTAFIGADNYEMGRQMGQYIASRLHGKGKVLEIMGLKGSSPAIERNKGFQEVMRQYPGIEVLATLQGDWTETTAYKVTADWLKSHPETPVDLVFGANDRTAMGARKAFLSLSSGKLPLFCGIDGLPGPNGGIRLVRDSILDASYIYPTHGDRVLQLAVDILNGKPYKKESRLMSAIVTRDNANVLLMETEEIIRQSAYLDELHLKADAYLRQLDTQRLITILACCVIVLLLLTILFFYRYHLSKLTLQRERVVNNLWNLSPENIPAPADKQSESDGQADEGPTTSDETPQQEDNLFIIRLKEVIEKRLYDSNLSVEDLAADMNLSRVQLYRKVKALTASSPVELLRTARLKRAHQLLLTTNLSVSEVAYQVGFTAPSYFTKCFKDEYGMLPGDAKTL